MKPQPRYRPGDRIGGRYKVHKALMGGMGEVYLCLDLEEMIPRALKTFQQRYISDAEGLRHAFRQEVAMWIALENHPNIVRCYMMQHLDYQPFMLLEWIAGEDEKGNNLRDWLRHGPLSLKLSLRIAIDICSGLIHAQKKQPGLVHRDLKPENILLSQGGIAKVTDFGLAQIALTASIDSQQANAVFGSNQSFVTRQGIAGTPAYMAPEQWRNGSLSDRTDIYAVGCILYEMLTGICAFQANSLPSTLQLPEQGWQAMKVAHLFGCIPELSKVFPSALNRLLQNCLAKDPADRPINLVDLETQLSNIYSTHVGDSPPIYPTPASFTADDYNNRGLTYAALRQYEVALVDYNCAIKLDNKNAKAYSNQGLAHHEVAQYEMALAAFNIAINLDASFASAYSNRGRTHHALGEFNLAIDDFTHALALKPNDARSYSNRGTTYKTIGQHELAIVDYYRSIELDPTFAEVYSNRGIIYAIQAKYEAALNDYNRAISLNPYYAEAYSNRGITYNKMGNHKAALDDYDRAIELDSTLAQAYYNRGMFYVESHQFLRAQNDFSSTINCNPNLVQAYSSRGATHEELGQYAEALADYTHAIELAPDFALVYLNLGVLWAKQEMYSKALLYFEKAAQLGLSEGAQYAEHTQKMLKLPTPV